VVGTVIGVLPNFGYAVFIVVRWSKMNMGEQQDTARGLKDAGWRRTRYEILQPWPSCALAWKPAE
jgi:hypothetical protein